MIWGPPTEQNACFEDSASTTPLIFILSSGADPFESLMTLATARGFADKLQSTSLGQGQGPIAAAMIAKGVEEGGWVLLQNCHLASSWMNEMEQICEKLVPETTHAQFRLWLTSMPSPKFPVAVLQNGIKMTVEPPKGLRANLRSTYLGLEDSWFEGCDKGPVFKKLMFGLAFFHAIVQERRKFGALGWNIPYGFNETDLRISQRQLHMFLNDYETTQWKAIKYLTGQCNYGGRVTDDWDRRCLLSILQNYYNPDLLDDSFQFLPDVPSEGKTKYFIPTDSPRQTFIDHILSLPLQEPPELFGLHPVRQDPLHSRPF